MYTVVANVLCTCPCGLCFVYLVHAHTKSHVWCTRGVNVRIRGKIRCAFVTIFCIVLSIDTIKLPDDWTVMAANEPYALVNLASTSAEYQKVERKFTASMQAGGAVSNGLHQVCFILEKSIL